MPKSNQPDSSSRKSKTRKVIEPAAARQEDGNSSLGVTTERSMSAVPAQSHTSPSRTDLVRSDQVSASSQRLGTGKRIRTPLPLPSGRTEEGNVGSRLAQQARRQPPADAAEISARPLGMGKRLRTPLPPPLSSGLEQASGVAGRPRPRQLGNLRNLPSALGEAGAGPVAKKLKEKAEQFQSIQDYLHNPVAFNLRSNEIQTTSTPEEIESRKGEVRYQIQLMKSVLAVLTEELDDLERARPQPSALPDNVRT